MRSIHRLYSHDGLALSGLVPELWISRIRTAAFGTVTMAIAGQSGTVGGGLFGTARLRNEFVPMLARTFAIRELRVSSRRAEQHGPLSSPARQRRRIPLHAVPTTRRPSTARTS